MSGHSKFANIKHKKEKNDAAKGKIFTKIGRELAIAVKEGGSADPTTTADFVMLLQKQKQTTCQMTRLNVVSKKLLEMQILLITNRLHMKDMGQVELLLS